MHSTRILAVDDDANQLAGLTRVLRRSRFEVMTTTNPRHGLRLAATERPDLILLDVSMPTMSGHEFLHRLRRAEEEPHRSTLDADDGNHLSEIPVIFLSGLAASYQKVSGLDAGAEDYIEKPFNPDELRARVRNQLRRVRHQRELSSPKRAEQLEAQSILNKIYGIVSTCGAPLLDLDIKLEMAGLVRQPELRNDLLARAQKDVERITISLDRLTRLAKPRGASK